MAGPPPPPHLTTNYQKLLEHHQHHQPISTSGFSPTPPPATSYSSSQGRYHSHVNQHHHNSTFQHDQRFEPNSKRMRFDNKEIGSQHVTADDFPYDDQAVKAKGDEIVQLLKQFPRPMSTKEIIKNCGHYFKLPLHPILVNLTDRGLILKQCGYGIESWRYNTNPPSPSHPGQPPSPPYQQFKRPPPQNFNTGNTPRSHYQQNQRFGNQRLSDGGNFNKSLSPQNKRPQTSQAQHQGHTSILQPKNKANSDNFFISSDVYNALNKNPVSALNELVQKNGASLSFELLCENPGSHKNKFTVAAMIKGKMYDAVSASNMKEAKRDAADAALKVILKDHATVEQQHQQHGSNTLLSNATHFDRMATLSHCAFIEKSNMVNEKFAGRKVVACMIMKRDYNDEGTVIALGTGNRCITGQRLSMEGKVVNDSHAEIVCRRAFISFLYAELDKHYSSQESIFEDGGYEGRSKVKDDVTFHLYISTAPCGDGALFTPRQNESVINFPTEHSPTFSAKSHGTTRSKIEDGEGTIPIDRKDAEQTFDGILRGQRLRTMSCSDKICRWNVVGLQGALLSHLIEPIYLESLTLGYLYDHGHLSRAVCCRLDKGDIGKLDNVLPMPYYLNHPWIGRVTQHEATRETEKTNNISINWCSHDQNPEVTDGRTGAQLTRTGGAPTPSRLCKLELMNRFRSLISKNSKFGHLLEIGTYRELKDGAVEFQQAKKCMVERFHALKLGPWVRKPREQDMF